MYFYICNSCICGAHPKVVSRGRKAAAKSWVRLLTCDRPIELTICATPVSSSSTGVGLLGLVWLCQRVKTEEETLWWVFDVSVIIKTLKAYCVSVKTENWWFSCWKICWMIVQSTYDPQCSGVLKLEGRKKEATLTFMVYHGPVHRLLTIWPGRQFVKGHQHTHTHGSLFVREGRNCDKGLSYRGFCIFHGLACLGPELVRGWLQVWVV